jgi:hypothetical protein
VTCFLFFDKNDDFYEGLLTPIFDEKSFFGPEPRGK